MHKPRLAIVLGIRPDVIRASILLNMLHARTDIDFRFIWSGQHYSDNLKDVFFRELGVPTPQIELKATGANDAELVSAIIRNLYPVLDDLRPDAVVFLGDTNTVMGCMAAAQLNIPIVHIEGCMRSYDWRMPEEKYRTTTDHLSDVIYAYFDEYKRQGVAEGLNPDNIVVTQNIIVDVLQAYYFERKSRYEAPESFYRHRGIERQAFYLATCHRRENVENADSLRNILALFAAAGRAIYFPASYRTQGQLKAFGLALPANVIMVDPIGYHEILTLMVNSSGVITDSGTVVEETAVLQVPSVQMRRSTERPQVYDCGSSVKFDPGAPADPPGDVIHRLESLRGRTWDHGLGDGRASQRIVEDLMRRAFTPDGFRNHRPDRYHLDISRSYMTPTYR